ncbi:hypothetical protein T440DRAFT_245595 [Plenodomus tracheiphilus IPT5]|uniref:Uncharacterized protein n=1 Tax=Plenodomus tracheiphilus IPT5 TaxID=1408161 RepID=A0A6A7BHG7_9PLEO|nr:hypothetical protein T440DRAFT_245595 [Plenodomus tracheiphilus IPT5]
MRESCCIAVVCILQTLLRRCREFQVPCLLSTTQAVCALCQEHVPEVGEHNEESGTLGNWQCTVSLELSYLTHNDTYDKRKDPLHLKPSSSSLFLDAIRAQWKKPGAGLEL